MKEVEKRVFTVTKEDGTKVKVSTRKPNNQEIEDAGMEYSKEFTKAVRHGLMPREALKSILRENGFWTQKDDAEIESVEDKIIALEMEDYGKDAEKRKRILSDIEALREHLVERRKTLSSFLEHTAEAKAYEAQRDYIVCSVTEYEDSGKRVWPGLTFRDEESGELVFRATYEHMTFVNNVPSQLEEPESKAEKKEVKPKVRKKKAKEKTELVESVDSTEEVADDSAEKDAESDV